MQKMFDAVLSASVDSWIHIQEGAINAAPIYLYIRHDGTFGNSHDHNGGDEVEIVEGDACGGGPVFQAPDQYLVLAPQFPMPQRPEEPTKFRFMLLGDGGIMPNSATQGQPALAGDNTIHHRPVLPASSRPVQQAPLTVAPGIGAFNAEDAQNKGLHGGYCGQGANSCGPEYDGYDGAPWPPTSPTTNCQAKGTPLSETADSWTCTMKTQLQVLDFEDPAAVLIARGITKLGLESADILRSHFSNYGLVKAVHVPYAFKKRRGAARLTSNDVSRSQRIAGRCFIVMATAEDAFKILEDGETHLVQGVEVTLDHFCPASVRGGKYPSCPGKYAT